MLSESKNRQEDAEASRWSYSSLGMALAAAFLVFIFFSRWWENHKIDRTARERADAVRAEADRRAVEMMGGNHFEILAFYSVPGAIARGEHSQLCYGVSNAKSVRIEPFAEELRPSFSRCVIVSPAKSTTYTFTADDGAGHTKTATTEVLVK